MRKTNRILHTTFNNNYSMRSRGAIQRPLKFECFTTGAVVNGRAQRAVEPLVAQTSRVVVLRIGKDCVGGPGFDQLERHRRSAARLGVVDRNTVTDLNAQKLETAQQSCTVKVTVQT